MIDPDGKPLREVRVVLQETGRYQAQFSVTGEDGQFSFTQVPPGLYMVTAFKGGFVSKSAGQGSLDPLSIRVSANAEINGLDLQLEKGGVITGRVTEENAEPVILANVEVVDPDESSFRARNYRLTTFVTDDRGMYRIFGLPTGKYLVRMSLSKPSGDQQETTRFYYPGVVSPRQAGAVEVIAGSEVRDVDVSIKRRDKGEGVLTGRITRRDGGALSDMYVSAYPEGVSSTTISVAPREDGSYEFRDLAMGNYIIEALAKDPKLVERTRARVFVTNTGATTTNIVIEPGASISGRFEFEDGTQPRQMGELSVGAIIDRRQVIGNVANDGSFIISRLPASSVKFWAQVGNSKYYVKRIVQGRVELSEGMISLEGGEQLSGIHVILSDQGARLAGTVREANGEGMAIGALVIVLPAEKERRRLSLANRQVRADQRGYFVIEGIEAGRYFVLAYRDLQSGLDKVPALERWLNEHQSAIPVVEVKSGAQQELQLKVIE